MIFRICTVLCLFVFLFSGMASAEMKKLEFQCNKESYPEVRKILAKKFKDVYEDRDRVVAYFHAQGETISAEDGDFCIAKEDLNQDGIDDIFLEYAFGTLHCSSTGCSIVVYFVDKKNHWKKVLALNAFTDSMWVTDAVNGYRTLKIAQKFMYHCDVPSEQNCTTPFLNTDNFSFVYDEEKSEYRPIDIDHRKKNEHGKGIAK